MNPKPSREETLFFAVAEMATPEERAAYLERECAGDAALRQRVETLLAKSLKADAFFGEELKSDAEGPGGTVLVPVTERAGDTIGRYKLLQQIGEGGCGVVYMAEQSEPVKRRVALKVIKLGMDTKQVVAQDGAGVYVAVLDTGLVKNWREYFPAERVDTELATAFTGGVNEHSPWDDRGRAANNDAMWDKDTDGHGTHVASTIIGYSLGGVGSSLTVNGVAPKATILPVKVLNQNGYGSNLDVVAGLYYIGWLRESGTVTARIVINMSLGVTRPSQSLEDAIDYAISRGVIIVAAAGNEGTFGMGWPGAYPQVISAAATGWKGAWLPLFNGGFWRNDVPEEVGASSESFIVEFSSRENDSLVPGYDQELDVSAPGLWTLGPYALRGAATPPYWSNKSFGEFYFLAGTSMASPHVAGVAALIMQKNPGLSQAQVEAIIKTSALPIPAGTYTDPAQGFDNVWGAGADEQGAGLLQADTALAITPAAP